jgi:hypothetical protein
MEGVNLTKIYCQYFVNVTVYCQYNNNNKKFIQLKVAHLRFKFRPARYQPHFLVPDYNNCNLG